MCAALVPREMPTITPRAVGSQCGAPRPVKAGTTITSPVSGTLLASAFTSDALRMMPSPSRSHWIALPPTNTLPSIA